MTSCHFCGQEAEHMSSYNGWPWCGSRSCLMAWWRSARLKMRRAYQEIINS